MVRENFETFGQAKMKHLGMHVAAVLKEAQQVPLRDRPICQETFTGTGTTLLLKNHWQLRCQERDNLVGTYSVLLLVVVVSSWEKGPPLFLARAGP